MADADSIFPNSRSVLYSNNPESLINVAAGVLVRFQLVPLSLFESERNDLTGFLGTREVCQYTIIYLKSKVSKARTERKSVHPSK